MGLTPLQIMIRVYLRESVPSIIRATTITLISLIGLTAIVGAIGGGGVGAFCYNYGYSKQWQYDIMWACVIALVLITVIIQTHRQSPWPAGRPTRWFQHLMMER